MNAKLYSTLFVLIFGIFPIGILSYKLSTKENAALQRSCGRYVEGYNDGSTESLDNKDTQFKLLYGNLAKAGQAPWAVSITRKRSDLFGNVVEGYYSQHGTGTLISPYHVVTAAHLVGISTDPKPDCKTGALNDAHFLYNQTSFFLFLNVTCATPQICEMLNRKDEFKPLNVRAIYVRKGYVGEGCPGRESFNDIAVFELEKPVKFSQQIYPVCIPQKKRVPQIGESGAKLFGYGRDPSAEQNKTMGILRTLDFDVSKCTIASLDGLFCTSSRSYGLSCDGDSGSGVVQKPIDSKAEHIIGVLSGGVSCENLMMKHEDQLAANEQRSKESDLLVDVSRHIEFFCACCGICPLNKKR